MEYSRTVYELVATGFELAAVGVMVIGAAVAPVAFTAAFVRHRDIVAAYHRVRRQIERAILLGLEVLIIADIIRSAALQLSIASISALGLLITICTFLSWSLTVELEGRWPWAARSKPSEEPPQWDTRD